MKKLPRTQILVPDDFGFAPLTDPERRDLLEVIADRRGASSTILTSQLPIENWHEYIGDPTIADAILDRLIHNAHRINLKGASFCESKGPLEAENIKTLFTEKVRGKDVTRSPGATRLVERRRSGAMDNFHLQKGIKRLKLGHLKGQITRCFRRGSLFQ
jgi:hypothetical protein